MKVCRGEGGGVVQERLCGNRARAKYKANEPNISEMGNRTTTWGNSEGNAIYVLQFNIYIHVPRVTITTGLQM